MFNYLILFSLLPLFLCARPVVALVAGKNAPPPQVVDILESSLYEGDAWTLLERRKLASLLAEQSLGALSAANAVKAGKLLSVGLFIFVDRVDNRDSPLLHIQIVEASTGWVLDAQLVSESMLQENPQAFIACLSQGLSKWQIPRGERAMVGLLSCRSEELGTELDEAADALGLIVMTSLNQAPTVVVVDREHQQQLLAEEQNAGLSRDLTPSGWLLELSLKQTASKQAWEIGLVANPLNRGTRLETRLTCKPDPRDARAAILDALYEHLAIHTKAPGDAPEEGTAFYRFAKFMPIDRELRLPYAAAAYALVPTPDHLLLYAELATGATTASGMAWTGHYACNLYERYYRQQIEALRQQGRRIVDLSIFQAQPQPRLEDTPSMSREEIEQEREIFRLRLVHYMARQDSHDDWYVALAESWQAAQRWSVDLDEFSGYATEMCGLVKRPKARWSQIGGEWRFLEAVGSLPENAKANPEQVQAYLDALRGLHHPMISLAAERVAMDPQAAAKVVDCYQNNNIYFMDKADRTTRSLSKEWTWEALLRLCPNDQAATLSKWRQGLTSLITILDAASEPNRLQELAEWLEVDESKQGEGQCQLIDLLLKQPDKQAVTSLEKLRGAILAGLATTNLPASSNSAFAKARLRVDQELARLTRQQIAVPKPWQAYHFAPVKWEHPPPGEWRIAGLVHTPDPHTVAVCWYELERHEYLPMIVSLADGATSWLKPAVGGRLSDRADINLASDGQQVSAVLPDKDIVLFTRSSVQRWSPGKDLPGKPGAWVGLCRGNLYVWCTEASKGALVRLDPQSHAITELFNTASATQRHPLEGLPNLELRMIYGEESTGLLWLGAHGSREFQGLWQFAPEANAATKTEIGVSFANAISPQGDFWLYDVGGNILHALHRPTLDLVGLLGYCRGVPQLFGYGSMGAEWPAAWLGEELILTGMRSGSSTSIGGGETQRSSANSHLFLFQFGKPTPAVLSALPDGQPPDIRAMVHLAEREFLFIRWNGDVWRVTRPAFEQPPGQPQLHFGTIDDLRLQEIVKTAPLPVAKATSSSFRPPYTTTHGSVYRHEPESVLDSEVFNHWWSASGDLAGAWLELQLESPSPIGRIAIVNSWIWGDPRIRTMTILLDGHEIQTVELAPSKAPQLIRLKTATSATVVRFRVDTLYPPTHKSRDKDGVTIGKIRLYPPSAGD